MLTAEAPFDAGVVPDAEPFFANSEIAAGTRAMRKLWRSPFSIPMQVAG